MNIIEGLSRAIARMEGFSSGASRIAVENNNPGNIRFWSKDTPQRGGFAVFDSLTDGVRALNKVVGDYISGRYTNNTSPTLEQMISKYAPAADKNDPDRYARLVSQWTGIPLGVPLNNVNWGESNIALVNANTRPILPSSQSSGRTTNFPTTGQAKKQPTTTSRVPKKR